MKAFLMHQDRDFALQRALPPNEADLAKDLELDVLLQAMSGGDQFLYAVARSGLHSGLASPAEIVYRQHVLADCVARSAVVRDMYQVAVAAVTGEKKLFGWLFVHDSPDSILRRAKEAMELFVGMLRQLRDLTDAHAASFRSEGFTRFFAMLTEELDDDYFAEIQAHLGELAFRHGMLVSAKLGRGSKGIGHVLRRQPEQGWRDRMPGQRRLGLSFVIPPQDENGFRALADLENRGLNDTANALAQSVDHIRSFFQMLCAELGFYIGCLNLRERLTAGGARLCFPVPVGTAPGGPVPVGPAPVGPAPVGPAPVGSVPAGTGQALLHARGLYDACLALTLGTRPVGNDVNADGRQLIMITGANQGGKSTFLRSLGLAQLMMQAGMFVAAEEFTASICTGLFTHYKREEDAAMEKGKLDEELARMSGLADQITAGGLLLCNESFASTNEREGSEIARQVIRALTEVGIRVVFVTHLYDLAARCYAENAGTALFLRAERQPDGRRTFRLFEGEPLPTSYGQDLYQQVFGTAPETTAR
jgi:MutS domain V